MMRPRLLLLCACLLGSSDRLWADDAIRQVQQALRRRNLYFGEVDGRKSEEVKKALQRFQQRQGFPADGELNASTLRSLEIAVPVGPKAEEEWPEGAVLRSESAREITESDKKFLEELEGKASPPENRPPESTFQEDFSEERMAKPQPGVGTEKLSPAPEVAPTAPPPSPATAENRPPPAAPEAPAPPTVPPAPVAEGPGPGTTARSDSLLTQQAQDFLQSYLQACSSNQVDQEMSFYAPRVNYFDHGMVDDSFVRKDVQRFYQRWPEREYELLDFTHDVLRSGERRVIFRIGFHYKGTGKQKVSGKTINVFKLKEEDGRLLFTSLKEQRVRN